MAEMYEDIQEANQAREMNEQDHQYEVDNLTAQISQLKARLSEPRKSVEKPKVQELDLSDDEIEDLD